jgi:hypothetical protein
MARHAAASQPHQTSSGLDRSRTLLVLWRRNATQTGLSRYGRTCFPQST